MFPLIMCAHFVGDFVCQTHEQATRKSKDWVVLLTHVSLYTWVVLAAMLIGGLWWHCHLSWTTATTFYLLTLGTHFATDWCTSRLNAHLFAQALKDERGWHNFFVSFAFDQLVHGLTLWYTLRWLNLPLV